VKNERVILIFSLFWHFFSLKHRPSLLFSKLHSRQKAKEQATTERAGAKTSNKGAEAARAMKQSRI
jgi:hypothetical protein